MVQLLEATDAQSAEQAPLLNNAGILDGRGQRYVSIAQLSPNSSRELADSNRNGTTAIKSTTGPASDEESQNREEVEEGIGRRHVVRIISVLLIGIFVANADGSILLATYPVLGSEFNDLENSSWLITSFALAGAATQTLYGKLSDIYGRKTLVIAAYVIFVAGCAIVGVGQTMWQVVLGRVISGAGASGMAGLVSILITDLLPIRDVAQWRAYVNLIATLGRSVGGPLGGWLVDVIGWRWSFFGQVPPIVIAILLVIVCLPSASPLTDSKPTQQTDNGLASQESSLASQESKFSRIDFKGSVLFTLTILALLLPVELGGVKLPWSHPAIAALFIASVALLVVFVAVEKRQEEPILPLEIFHRRDAVFSFLILGLQLAAQLGLMFSVPLYFQITARASSTAAGAHLVPAVVGNALGGLISGLLIKRSGRYKALIILAVTLSASGYLLLMLRWHGDTNIWESLYIFPSGFGMGVAQSAVFISLQAVIAEPSHLAPAISFMYLTGTIGLTIGVPLANAVTQTVLRRRLGKRLLALGLRGQEVRKIIANAVSDVYFVDRVTGRVRDAVVESYVDGLWWSHGVSFLLSATALVLALFIKQKPLPDRPRA
ncbi:major facilitator superfamily domain-containing protein [Chaetomium strumarium]|uniref:Major facilitator superfamily domain-containing protein n=1 Tax=Chaetomium strumarium TaxID=1170767 RepID=A0AAJ0GSN8_9PEZI|nr:major facilitator superfamily domain-containing protein [Chaetomium strumarium]